MHLSPTVLVSSAVNTRSVLRVYLHVRSLSKTTTLRTVGHYSLIGASRIMSIASSALSLRQSHSTALDLSQQSSRFLRKNEDAGSVHILPSSDSTELWLTYEKLLLACLTTGDDKAAHACLERMITRFGATNERVMGLRGLYQEAVAENDAALERILREYEEVLAENPINAVGPSRPATTAPMLTVCEIACRETSNRSAQESFEAH